MGTSLAHIQLQDVSIRTNTSYLFFPVFLHASKSYRYPEEEEGNKVGETSERFENA